MNDTQLIKDKIDVVDLISEYVQLKPAGINHKGLCPFHNEKSPSFMANRERQSWHCFGCAKGGDIFTFVQEIEGVEFVEALKILAQKAGIELTQSSRQQTESNQKNRIKEINAIAAKFYHHVLTQLPVAEPARAYLVKRGLTNETIEQWHIGFIPDQWDLLTKYLLKKGYSIDDLLASGLVIKREGADIKSGRGFYDRFRGRIMFPIWDVHGNVVGFTGRVLVETEKSGGKYVNTPQTSVYDKSHVVFGLNKAKQDIRSNNLIVMVEGQMDVIACHQAGMKNVVATSGTAMTEHQVRLLKRYSTNLTMAFDADAAGQSAAKRGIDIALKEGLNVKVIRIPEGAGKDPDECIKQNKDVWFDAVKNAEDIMHWYFSKAFAGKNLSDPKQKQAVANELLPEIALIPFAVERDHWLRELSGRLGVDVSVLREDMARIGLEDAKKEPGKVVSQKPSQSEQKSRVDIYLERILMLILRLPGLYPLYAAKIENLPLSTSSYAPLYETIKMQYSKQSLLNIDDLRANTEAHNGENIVSVLLMKGELDFSNFSEEDLVSELETSIAHCKSEWRKKRGRELQSAIGEAEKAQDHDRLRILLEEFQSLSK